MVHEITAKEKKEKKMEMGVREEESNIRKATYKEGSPMLQYWPITLRSDKDRLGDLTIPFFFFF